MGDLQGYEVGQKIELSDGRVGVIQFLGNTHFADGSWIGLVLDDLSGKNDGAVQGKRYFSCDQGHGMFVRPTAITEVLAQPAPKAVKKVAGTTNGTAPKTRPLSNSNLAGATKRQSLVDPTAAKRRSINAQSPTPTSRAAAPSRSLRSPTKSPTKPTTSRLSSGAASLRNPPTTSTSTIKSTSTVAKRTSVTGRPSLASTSSSTRAPRPSISGSGPNGAARGPGAQATTRSVKPSTKPTNRLSSLQQQPPRPSSVSATSQSGRSGAETPSEDKAQDSPSTGEQDSQDGSSSPPERLASPLQPAAAPQGSTTSNVASPAASRVSAANASLTREIEDLKTKLRVLEKQRGEDREKLKALEKVQEERDRFESIIQKLQKKYQPQQQEITDLKKQIKDLESQLESGQSGQMDIDTAVEIAHLDREMAEETSEAYRQELESLRHEHEELKLEVEILREENSELGKEMSTEERTSQGWLQLERSNERLREALIRLRDMTQDTEAELKDHIHELETDNKDLEGFKEQFEDMKAKAEQFESVADDLRQQLETVQGAEDMIEELTEKNMALTEQIDDLKTAIEDLENLKELNDELELNHIENEKQMQEEIDYQEALFLEQQRLANGKDEAIEELEYTCSKFRELVNNLQAEIEDMRSSQQITETEANELSNRSRAMMDLNMRLQASASKAQVKAIEVEIGKLEAQEASDHLAIVRNFLPQAYASDRDSVETYLRIKRIGFKANMLHGYVRDRAGGVAVPGHEEDVFAANDAADKLAWLSAMCERLSSFVQRCSLEAFTKFATALADLEPVERACNAWIDGLKRDDFKDTACAAEAARSIALMTHLAEAHLGESLQEYADTVRMHALVMQSQLENAAGVISQIKSVAQAKILLPSDADEQDEADQERFLERADQLASQIRSCKVVAGKGVQQVADLHSRALTLDPSTEDQMEQAQTATKEYAAACQEAAAALLKVLNDDVRTDSFTYEEATRALGASDTLPFTTLTNKLSTVSSQVQAFHALTSSLSHTTEFPTPAPPAPWTLLAQRMQAESAASSAQEREVARLRDELKESGAALTMKDKALEEMGVNVEVLTRRVQEAGGRREEMRKLEAGAKEHERQERELAAELSRARDRLRDLEAEREDWQRRAAALPSAVGGLGVAGQEGVDGLGNPTGNGAGMTLGNLPADFVPARAAAEMAALRAEVAALQAAIRHLREAAYRTSLSSAGVEFLAEPLYPKPAAPESAHTRVGREAKDCLRALLDVVGSDGAKVPELKLPAKPDRLKWRPAKETVAWQVRRQRENWAAWTEWRDDVARKQREAAAATGFGRDDAAREQDNEAGAGQAKAREPRRRAPLARIAVGLPGKEWEGRGRKVRIVRPEEWRDVERGMGLVPE